LSPAPLPEALLAATVASAGVFFFAPAVAALECALFSATAPRTGFPALALVAEVLWVFTKEGFTGTGVPTDFEGACVALAADGAFS
jgi:hypothetical protein